MSKQIDGMVSVTEVAVQFKQVPSLLFRETSIDRLNPNFLVLRIQPNEGISGHLEKLRMGSQYEIISGSKAFWVRPRWEKKDSGIWNDASKSSIRKRMSS